MSDVTLTTRNIRAQLCSLCGCARIPSKQRLQLASKPASSGQM